MARFTAIVIASIMVVSALVMFSSSTQDAHASATGDTYGGSGNWIINNPTVYDGTNVAVHGNVYIQGSGSLTIRSATLTLDEASQYQYVIHVNTTEGFRAVDATLTTSDDDTDVPWGKIQSNWGGRVRISNSTVEYFYVLMTANDCYVDNSSLTASCVIESSATGFQRLNVSYNDFYTFVGPNAVFVCSDDSRVVGNVFHTSIAQTHDPTYPGLINALGAGVQCDDTLIADNIFQCNIPRVGIWTGQTARITIRDNIFQEVNATLGYVAIGIQLNGEGSNSIVSGNTFRMVKGSSAGTWSIGISLAENGRNYSIDDNDIWSVIKLADPAYASTGIWWAGSYGDITNNRFGNVTGDEDGAYGMSTGILVGGENTVSRAYVTISGNTIDLLDHATNGIVFSGRSYGQVDNNTIHTISFGSNGMGAYIADAEHDSACFVDFLDNEITDLHRDSCGIIITHNASHNRVLRNTVHISGAEPETTYPERAGILVCGESWVAPPFNGASWTGIECLVAYNIITNADPDDLDMPEYLFWDAYLSAGQDYLQVIIEHDNRITARNATFTLMGYSGMPMVEYQGSEVSLTVSTTQYSHLFNFTDEVETIHHLNVTATGVSALALAGSASVTMLTWNPLEGLSNAVVASWSVEATAGQSYTVTGLDPGTSYKVYLDGQMIYHGYGTSLTFASTSGGEFEIRVAHPATVSKLLVLTVNMLALGLMVGVIGAAIKPLKDPKNRRPEVFQKVIINAMICIVVGVILITMVNDMFLGG